MIFGVVIRKKSYAIVILLLLKENQRTPANETISYGTLIKCPYLPKMSCFSLNLRVNVYGNSDKA